MAVNVQKSEYVCVPWKSGRELGLQSEKGLDEVGRWGAMRTASEDNVGILKSRIGIKTNSELETKSEGYVEEYISFLK